MDQAVQQGSVTLRCQVETPRGQHTLWDLSEGVKGWAVIGATQRQGLQPARPARRALGHVPPPPSRPPRLAFIAASCCISCCAVGRPSGSRLMQRVTRPAASWGHSAGTSGSRISPRLGVSPVISSHSTTAGGRRAGAWGWCVWGWGGGGWGAVAECAGGARRRCWAQPSDAHLACGYNLVSCCSETCDADLPPHPIPPSPWAHLQS